MLKRPDLFLLFGILFMAVLGVQAQNLKAYETAGDDAFAVKEYYNAVFYYEKVLRSKDSPSLHYKYAESLRLSHAYKAAELEYEKVLKSNEKNKFPFLEFFYGITLKHNGKYADAKRAFKNFIKQYRRENYFKKKAKQEYQSCDVAIALNKNEYDTNELQLYRLNDQINSEYSDFAAHEIGDTLYFSSLRFNRKKVKKEPKDRQAKDRLVSRLLYVSDTSKAKTNEWNELNLPHLHNANSTLSKDAQTLIFSRCNARTSDSLICSLYKSYRLKNGQWSKPEKLPRPINDRKYSTTQPHLAWDEDEKIEWLYFVSDRRGGLGKMDIYRVPFTEDLESQRPLNLGDKINSIDDEITPFYHPKTKRLYFSSNWHHGLGGFDIFYTKNLDNGWQDPVNLGIPFNSAANDMYFVVNSNDTTGYLSSNREGSRTLTEESCCNDIYAYAYLIEIELDTPEVKDSTELVELIQDTILTTDTLDIVEILQQDSSIVEIVEIEEIPLDTFPRPKVYQIDDLLPLNLYFHNDEPDSNTNTRFTNTPYQQSHDFYTSLIPTYLDQYSKQFESAQVEAAKSSVSAFFDEMVEGEYEKVQAFLDELILLMQEGYKLRIFLRGFTSPRAKNRYNLNLAHRRVSSLRNYIIGYNGNFLKPYVDRGDLLIDEAMLGESMSAKGVSDSLDDPQNSIYSPRAARERRAEISILVEQ